jgi:integrase
MLAAGASPRTVMKTLGHSQIGLTMNTYAHVLPEVERAAIDAAARAIFE